MSKKFIVRTEPKKPDSLKEPVRIAFTLTPVESGKPTHPYDPIAMWVTDFPIDSVTNVDVQWGSTMNFCTYRITGSQASLAQMGPSVPSEGQAVALTSPGVWGRPSPCDERTSFVALNKSGSTANILIGRSYMCLAYRPLKDDCSIVVPSSFHLQAYVVNDAITGRTILQPEDLKRPVFTSPIGWDALPDASTWTLCQDNKGTLRIKNKDFPGLGYSPSAVEVVELLQEPTSKKDSLSEVLDRLAVMEQSINRMQDDINELRNQVSASDTATSNRLSGFDRGITAVEDKATTLAESFGQSQDRLSVIHRAVTDTQQLFTEIKRTTNGLGLRVPAVESKAEMALTSSARSQERLSTLEESASRTQNHVIAVEKAVHQTQDHVSVVQQLVVNGNTQPSTMRQVPRVADEPVPTFHSTSPPGDDKQIPAVEARVEKLEKSAQEQRKALRLVDRRLPKLEADMGAVQGVVTSLTHRVSAMEARSEDDDSEPAVEDGPLSPSAGQGSPILFPRYLSGGPPAA